MYPCIAEMRGNGLDKSPQSKISSQYISRRCFSWSILCILQILLLSIESLLLWEDFLWEFLFEQTDNTYSNTTMNKANNSVVIDSYSTSRNFLFTLKISPQRVDILRKFGWGLSSTLRRNLAENGSRSLY